MKKKYFYVYTYVIYIIQSLNNQVIIHFSTTIFIHNLRNQIRR